MPLRDWEGGIHARIYEPGDLPTGSFGGNSTPEATSNWSQMKENHNIIASSYQCLSPCGRHFLLPVTKDTATADMIN